MLFVMISPSVIELEQRLIQLPVVLDRHRINLVLALLFDLVDMLNLNVQVHVELFGREVGRPFDYFNVPVHPLLQHNPRVEGFVLGVFQVLLVAHLRRRHTPYLRGVGIGGKLVG